MLNNVTIQGRLVADPELRSTQSGVAVATFRLACDRDTKNKETGERATDFINVVAWRSTAEFAHKFLSKGRMAIVMGRLQVRSYTDKDGNKRTASEVVVGNIYFGDSKKDAQDKNFDQLNQTLQDHGYSASPDFSPMDDDGPIPF
jgi:single-strand DNA-binding protein